MQQFISELNIDDSNIGDYTNKDISDIDKFDDLNSIATMQILKLRNNRISHFNEETMSKFTELKYLDISGNMLEQINGLQTCTSLVLIDASRNQLKELSNLENLKSLKRILAGKNEINKIYFRKPLTGVILLDLHHNEVNSLDFGGFFPKLEQLHLDENKLESIEGLDFFQNLLIFTARSNNINHIPELTTRNLQYLDLADNKITNIDHALDIKTLSCLILNGNPIENSAFAGGKENKNLTILKLARTKITNPSFIANTFPNIEFLDLTNCEIENLDDIKLILKKCRLIRSIDFRFTPITEGMYLPVEGESPPFASLEAYGRIFSERSAERAALHAEIAAVAGHRLERINNITLEQREVSSSYYEEEEEGYSDGLNQVPKSLRRFQDETYSYTSEVSYYSAVEQKPPLLQPTITTISIAHESSSSIPEEEEKEPIPEPVQEPKPIPEPVQEPEPIPEPVQEPKPIPDPKPSLKMAAIFDAAIDIEDRPSTPPPPPPDTSEKDNAIKKLKSENQDLEKQLAEAKRINDELSKRRMSSSSKSEAEAIIAAPPPQRALELPRNDKASPLVKEVLKLMGRHNELLVKELLKQREKMQKLVAEQRNSQFEQAEPVEYLIRENAKLKDELRSSDRLDDRLIALAQGLQMQNVRYLTAIERQRAEAKQRPYDDYSTESSYCSHRHHHSHRSHHHHHSDREERSHHHHHHHRSERDSKRESHHKNYGSRDRPEEQKPSPQSINKRVKPACKEDYESDFPIKQEPPRKRKIPLEPENCERMILGCARMPHDSMYHIPVAPNTREFGLIEFWATYVLGIDTEVVGVIKAATHERFIEVEWRYKTLSLFVVPTVDPSLYFDGCFPSTIVAYRKFDRMPKAKNFLVIAADLGTKAYSEAAPSKSEQLKYRREKFNSVVFMDRGSSAVAILDTSRCVPIYSFEIH